MMHVLIGEGLVDHAYIQRATLGFGPLARVVSPPELVRQIQEEADKTRLQYAAVE